MVEGQSTLDTPITLKLSGKIIPNRIYRSALSEYGSTYDKSRREECGKPTDEYTKLYHKLADGGAGLICFGNIPIDRDQMENTGNAVLDPRNAWDAVRAFAPAIRAAKSRGAICLPQLQHPGRQCPEFINPNPRSSSDVQLMPVLNKTFGKPTSLSTEDIQDIIQRYAWAAETLAKAGADGIILHASHGYLITQFLSPKLNKRTDEYGGSLENRSRFLLAIIAATKSRVSLSNFVLAAKFNCHDFIDGGMSFAESCVVLKWLEDAGVDFFDISGGTYASPAWRGDIMTELAQRPSQKERGSYFIEWAQEMKKILSRAVIGTTGGWREGASMARAIANGDVDMIGLGRPLRTDPNLPKKLLKEQHRQRKL